MAKEEQVLVTIEASYGKDKKGGEIPCILRYGYEEATLVSGPNAEGEVPGGMDNIVDAGAHQGIFPRTASRFRPGKPNDLVLVFGDPERESGMMSRAQARLLFGHERIPKQAAPETDPRWTFQIERQRVAMLWGNWRLPRLALNGTTHCRKGENDFDMTKIGPPRVPVVRIEAVNQSGKVKGDPFRPWAWFAWEDDCDLTHPEITGSAQAKPDVSALAGFTLADLEAFIAFRRAQGESAPAAPAKARDAKGHFVKEDAA